ncbi:glycerophosphodiester phosphodiesterase [uncultured Methanomethylovorans sp.]|uniref:glycerophosphodiester phosphodiesterase n=1 Tax=uncultured Methanomethylovorans sp. TaxID=183759 RepID=UPI002AA7947B|nr:glycerophosphodiester phosphodiesterase [uncultured Methanomethylovorans sp.]
MVEIEKLLKDSWEIFQKNIVAFIVGTLIAGIGSILIVTIAPLFYGVVYMAVKGIKGEKVEIADVFAGFKVSGAFVQSWIVVIVYLVLMIAGSMLLGRIGGIIGILLIYALPLLVMREYKGADALKENFELIQKYPADTAIVFLIFFALNYIGSLIIIGALITFPLSMIGYTLTAKHLAGNSQPAAYIEG